MIRSSYGDALWKLLWKLFHYGNAYKCVTGGNAAGIAKMRPNSSAVRFRRITEIPSRITTKSIMRRFDHDFIGDDPESARVPPGYGGSMLVYSPPTLAPLSLEEDRRSPDLET